MSAWLGNLGEAGWHCKEEATGFPWLEVPPEGGTIFMFEEKHYVAVKYAREKTGGFVQNTLHPNPAKRSHCFSLDMRITHDCKWQRWHRRKEHCVIKRINMSALFWSVHGCVLRYGPVPNEADGESCLSAVSPWPNLKKLCWAEAQHRCELRWSEV